MKKVGVRKSNMPSPHRKTPSEGRLQHKFTSGLSVERQQELERYIRNAERGRLAPIHDGRDVTRQITAAQVKKFLACKNCRDRPVVYFWFDRQLVGVCAKDWIELSDKVIGWSATAAGGQAGLVEWSEPQ